MALFAASFGPALVQCDRLFDHAGFLPPPVDPGIGHYRQNEDDRGHQAPANVHRVRLVPIFVQCGHAINRARTLAPTPSPSIRGPAMDHAHDNSDHDDHDGAAGPPMPSAAAMDALITRIDRPIVLVGLMGVGKSTVGRKLAQVLTTPFVDADDAITAAAQMPIPDIFDQYGEAHFRDGERRVIARLIEENTGRAAVIATGGGAFADDETRSLILDRAIAVWLDARIEVLAERVGRKQTRPLLIGRDPHEVLAELMAKRGPAYAQAPIRIVSDQGPHAHSVARILAALMEYVT